MTRRAFFALALLPWLPKPVPQPRGPLTVVVNNYSNAKLARPTGPGRRQLEVLIRETTRRGIQTGQFDRLFRRVYGR